MPIEIRELVLRATVRTETRKEEKNFLTKSDLYEFERNLKRNLKREIQREIKAFKARR